MSKTRKSLTEEEKKQYISNSYGRCPYCQDSGLEGDSYEGDGNVIAQEITYQLCQRSWTDIYTLSGIEEASIGPQPDDDDYCPDSEDHRHEADPSSIEVADGYDPEAEKGIVFTVACKHCRRRCGAGKIPTADICW